MTVFVPDNLADKSHAAMYMTGGSNDGTPCKLDDEDCAVGAALAMTARTVTAVLFNIPCEPVHFLQEPGQPRRTEDAVIAYTWWHFIQYPDQPEWLLRLPMTKAAIRALDTIQTYASENLGLDIEKFLVAGASKRGWTTWTTGIVDTRVVAIVPMVMDLLNFHESVHHHFRSLGGWTFAFDVRGGCWVGADCREGLLPHELHARPGPPEHGVDVADQRPVLVPGPAGPPEDDHDEQR